MLKFNDENTIKLVDEIADIDNIDDKKNRLKELLNKDAEARMFEIVSFSILRSYYMKKMVFFGETKHDIQKYPLTLYKTGRTNANDGGIDFVLKPIGRFFQVSEVEKYDKYFLDIDKVMHYPITFVIRTSKDKETVREEMINYLENKYEKNESLKKKYEETIEDIITLNEMNSYIEEFTQNEINEVIECIKLYFTIEMNLNAEENSEDDELDEDGLGDENSD